MFQNSCSEDCCAILDTASTPFRPTFKRPRRPCMVSEKKIKQETFFTFILIFIVRLTLFNALFAFRTIVFYSLVFHVVI